MLLRFPRRLEPVEKVAAGSIESPEPGSKLPKIGPLAPEWELEKNTKEFFNRLRH
jgi:hypothetical protein